MPARWNRQRELELIRLVNLKRFTYQEIADQMGLNRNQVTTKGQALGLKNSVYLNRITKHAHLRESVMRYFLTHSWEQTRKNFGLTQSELRSLFTVGYLDPKYTHLRKETRLHTAWSDQDWKFMVRYSGVMPREWIAKKLRRGSTYNSVKDALAKFRGLGKYMNGMPSGWAVDFLSAEELGLAIKMRAGPTGCSKRNADFRYRLIPWVTLVRLIKYRRIDPEVKIGIKAMARFQYWIHGTKNETVVRRHILKAVSNGL